MVNVSKNAATSFVDRESDATIKQKRRPRRRMDEQRRGVLLYDKFDVWKVAANGSGATRLTDGAAEQIRHRYLRLDPDEEWIDPSKPMHVSLFGSWTKRSGYGRLDPGAPAVKRLLFDDKSITGLARAKDADVYAYVAQRFDDPPAALVGGPDLKDAKIVVKTNAFASDYAWGKSELIEHKNDRGERMQGAPFPSGRISARQGLTPMIVYDERLSDGLHR